MKGKAENYIHKSLSLFPLHIMFKYIICTYIIDFLFKEYLN